MMSLTGSRSRALPNRSSRRQRLKSCETSESISRKDTCLAGRMICPSPRSSVREIAQIFLDSGRPTSEFGKNFRKASTCPAITTVFRKSAHNAAAKMTGNQNLGFPSLKQPNHIVLGADDRFAEQVLLAPVPLAFPSAYRFQSRRIS